LIAAPEGKKPFANVPISLLGNQFEVTALSDIQSD